MLCKQQNIHVRHKKPKEEASRLNNYRRHQATMDQTETWRNSIRASSARPSVNLNPKVDTLRKPPVPTRWSMSPKSQDKRRILCLLFALEDRERRYRIKTEDKSSEVPAPEVVSIFLIFPHMRLLSVKPPLCLPRHLAIDENCKKKTF